MVNRFVIIMVIIVFILSACQTQSLESPMGIKWQNPPYWWGEEETGENPDGSYAYTTYYFDPESSNSFTAHRYSTSRELREYETEQLEFYRYRITNDNQVYKDTAKEYTISICNIEAIVFEWESDSQVGKYDKHIIKIFFSMDKILYNIDLISLIRDEDVNYQRIEQFWKLVDSIECPSED